MTRPCFDLVVAVDAAWGIGRDGQMPWPRLRRELAHFKRLTTTTDQPGKRNAVIMGRKTWESIPPKFRPLPERLNLVLTRRDDFPLPEGVVRACSIDDALAVARAQPEIDRLFVIGGAEIYRAAVELPECSCVYLTRIDTTYEVDSRFPDITGSFAPVELLDEVQEAGLRYRIELWRRR